MKRIFVLIADDVRKQNLEDFRAGYIATVIYSIAGGFFKGYDMPKYTDLREKMKWDSTPKDNRSAQEIKNDILKRMQE